jgi:lipoate-protein ligase A
MKLFDLGTIPWRQSQLVYHALGTCGEESIVICTPQDKYACVGFHQSPSEELDIDYCTTHGIGIFRREIGGGTVFLDKNQIFYQIILNRERAPMDQRVLFKKYLVPIIGTYRAFGINAKYYPVSDLVVDGKKISGNGGGDIGDCKVMTGSILLDFDQMTMCHILKLPSEKFRDDVCKAMNLNLTTIKNELGYIPKLKQIKSQLVSNLESIFGTLKKSDLDKKVNDTMEELDTKFSTDKWLNKKMKRSNYRAVKIIEGFYLIYFQHQSIEICLETKNEMIYDIRFYSLIEKELEKNIYRRLVGKKFDEKLILNTIKQIKN